MGTSDAGFTCDANLKQCVDPAIDEQRCNAEVLKANEVKFSPGGDKVGIRFEVKQATDLVVPPCPTTGDKPAGCHEGVELVLQPKVEQEVVQAIIGSGVQLRGTAQDVAVKGKEGVQSKDFRVEVQLKSIVDPWLQNTMGFHNYPTGANGVRQWIDDLGGFPLSYKAEGNWLPSLSLPGRRQRIVGVINRAFVNVRGGEVQAGVPKD